VSILRSWPDFYCRYFIRIISCTKRLVRANKKAQWENFIAEGSKAMAKAEWNKAWQWVKVLGQRTHDGIAGPQPVRDEDGVLLIEQSDITRAWASHYAALAHDVTGHSKSYNHWVGKEDKRLPVIEGLDSELTWQEFNQALTALKGRKAPGVDGLLPEWFHAMAEASTPAENASTPMGRVYLRILQGVWRSGSVPD
jgi:hypothetical protein